MKTVYPDLKVKCDTKKERIEFQGMPENIVTAKVRLSQLFTT
jgi:hypothetical protein